MGFLLFEAVLNEIRTKLYDITVSIRDFRMVTSLEFGPKFL